MTKPILEKLGNEFAEKVEFMSVNADDSPEVVEQFKVMSIPTVITLRDGKEIGRSTGAKNEEGYRAIFKAASEGVQLKKSISQLDRSLRLGAGALLIMEGFSSHNWIVVAIGGIIAFLGVYDRCPIWKTLTGMLKRN